MYNVLATADIEMMYEEELPAHSKTFELLDAAIVYARKLVTSKETGEVDDVKIIDNDGNIVAKFSRYSNEFYNRRTELENRGMLNMNTKHYTQLTK